MVAMRIDANVRIYSSWGAASALGVVLILVTAVLLGLAYWSRNRFGDRNELVHTNGYTYADQKR